MCSKKKIRLRTYSNQKYFNFETKISSVEGRYKTTKIIKKKIMRNYYKTEFLIVYMEFAIQL